MRALILSLGALCIASSVSAMEVAAVGQRPWIVNDHGTLKSETELTIDNDRGSTFDAWVKVGVAGKPDCMEPLTGLVTGRCKRIVHVPELGKDGDLVTFALFDNAAGSGAPLCAKTLKQQKVRHWRLYVLHNSHQDIGYTDHQDYLRLIKWPSFWDQALKCVAGRCQGAAGGRGHLPARSGDSGSRCGLVRDAAGALEGRSFWLRRRVWRQCAQQLGCRGTGSVDVLRRPFPQGPDGRRLDEERDHARRAVHELGHHRRTRRKRNALVHPPAQLRPQPVARYDVVSRTVLCAG